MRIKKRQAYYIAPLNHLTLAAFRPWEGSAGAGRVRPAGRKDMGFDFTCSPVAGHIKKMIIAG